MTGAGLPIRAARRVGVYAALVGLLPATLSRAEYIPTRGVVDSRVRVASYDPAEVYRLHGFVGYQIELQFAPGESFIGLGAGDLDALSFVAQDNHLFIKPKAPSVDTNLTVLTTRHSYQIDYSASADRPVTAEPRTDVIYSLRFVYPLTSGSAAVAEGMSRLLEQPTAGRSLNLDYWYCGDPSLMPVAASDDGVHTRIRFSARLEQPAIFAHNEDGSETLLNFSMDADDIIVHRVLRELIVRRGRSSGHIRNRAFTGSGERSRSGTITPEVERAIPGARP